MWGDTVNPHYLQIPYLQIPYSRKFIDNAQINSHGAFIIISRYARRGEKFKLSNVHVSEARQDLLPSYFSSHCKQMSFSLSIACNIFLLFVGDFTV